jgi:sugar phosphate isomerase/epimerase
MDFRLSQDSFSLLKKWQVVGMNAPSKFKYRNDRFTRNVIGKMRQVYALINARYTVFHTHTIEDWSILAEESRSQISMQLCIENDRQMYGITADRMLEILDEHPYMTFVLNTAHALSIDKGEVARLIELLGDRIAAVHLSARTEEKDHTPLHLADEETLAALAPVAKLDCPMVIECFHAYKDSIDEEISFVREFLSKNR